MLTITVPASEFWDERTNEFVSLKQTVIDLEHSLISISRWESKWRKAFLNDDDKTSEEVIDYIKCMTITRNVNPLVYESLTSKNIEEIIEYINTSQTASTVNHFDEPERRIKVTSELIYSWMISLGIPHEFEKWHLSRLLMLIDICAVRNAPAKMMSKSEIMRRNSELNAARRAKFNSKG